MFGVFQRNNIQLLLWETGFTRCWLVTKIVDMVYFISTDDLTAEIVQVGENDVDINCSSEFYVDSPLFHSSLPHSTKNEQMSTPVETNSQGITSCYSILLLKYVLSWCNQFFRNEWLECCLGTWKMFFHYAFLCFLFKDGKSAELWISVWMIIWFDWVISITLMLHECWTFGEFHLKCWQFNNVFENHFFCGYWTYALI